MPPTQPVPSTVRYHSRPPDLNGGAVVRVTGLTPQQLAQLEAYIEQQLGGKRYQS